MPAIDTHVLVRHIVQDDAAQSEAATRLIRDGSADVADGLHIALAAQAGELPLWTFDRRAARLRGVAQVEG
jgi:predicted nucleic acid-binding protein